MSEKTSRKDKLFVMLSGNATVSNSYRLPESQKAEILNPGAGFQRALKVEICETPAVRAAVTAALKEAKVSKEVAEAVAKAIDEASQTLYPRLHLSNTDENGKPIPEKHHNLTGRFVLALDQLKTVKVAEKKAAVGKVLATEDVLKALLGE